jgi:membrane protein insertase Oxa1/YidC/SpoIIIJ
MQATTYILPVVTFVFGLTLPSALAVYWTITSIVAAFQQYWVLHRDAEELEEGTPQSPTPAALTPVAEAAGSSGAGTATGGAKRRRNRKNRSRRNR